MRFVALVLVIITLFAAEMYFNSVRNLDSCYDKLEDAGYKFDELAEFGPSNCRVKKPIKLYSLPNTTLNTPITLSCPFAKRVGDWASDINAKSIAHVGGYNCRKIAGSPFMSQHSYAKLLISSKLMVLQFQKSVKERLHRLVNILTTYFVKGQIKLTLTICIWTVVLDAHVGLKIH